MTNPAVFWPATLGMLVLVVGIITYWDDAAAPRSQGLLRPLALGPVFVAAALAAFAGEHFTAAPTLAQIVPKFLPGPLFIAYFVGAAHLAAALSFVAKRYVRLSSLGVAVMFGLFVVLMDLPAAVARPGIRVFWILVARQTTFSVGALAFFAIVTSSSRPQPSARIAMIARLWTACVLVFYGTQNLLYPQFSPGVPDTTPVARWIPGPNAIAYVTGLLMIGCGLAMLVRKAATSAAACAGLWMSVLAVALYVPQFFMGHSPAEQVNALNFVFDTLLFGGMMLIVGAAQTRGSRATVESYTRAGTGGGALVAPLQP